MSERLYGLTPAAGTGARLGGDTPKQYLPLAGAAMIVHAVRALLSHPDIETVFVVLSPEDTRFAELDWSDCGERLAPLYCGGPTRRDSVRNGLVAVRDVVDADDWILVHDAARPGLSRDDLARLVDAVRDDEVGGILAVPLADTLKRADAEQRIVATAPREGLWRAQTPQMFRYGTLLRGLDAAPDATDEASAVEALGLRPRLVLGSARNMKITYPGDMAAAERLLTK
nr:MAG: 2-C-methyl-D-erythritol 4-phosphate cytidylyltransferase [Pseudomonadota bacterium]